jgi:hypothetical protein
VRDTVIFVRGVLRSVAHRVGSYKKLPFARFLQEPTLWATPGIGLANGFNQPTSR